MATLVGVDAEFVAVQAGMQRVKSTKEIDADYAHPPLVDEQLSVDQCGFRRTFSADAPDYPFAVSMTFADSTVMSVRGRSLGPHGVLPISSTTA